MITEAMLNGTPGETFKLRSVRPGIQQLIAPIFHEDGDMMNIYLEECEEGIKITDHGMSLMRLSYLFDVDTDNKQKLLNDIVISRNAELQQGRIEYIVNDGELFPSIMNFAQIVTEVCGMNMLSREVIVGAFYDEVREAVQRLDMALQYTTDYQPKGLPDVNIDYAFFGNGKVRPIYMFAVKDTNKAMQTIIDCLQLELHNIPCKTLGVYEDIDALKRKTRTSFLNTVGKTFNMEGFREKGEQYIVKELEVA